MKKVLPTSLCFLLSSIVLFGQGPQRVEMGDFHPTTVDLAQIKHDWNPVMSHLEAPVPGSGSYRSFLQEHKASLYDNYQPKKVGSTALRTADLPVPVMEDNFEGNAYNNSVPNDNDVAISNDGWVISVINSTIWVLDTTGVDTFRISLNGFVDTLGIVAGKFDPKVQYDPLADRFIIVFLGGFDTTNTHIFVCFSSTNNPLDPWNVYNLPGNPLGDGTWTDYPMMALTDDELFITVNLLRQGESWQTGFSQTLIWHMDKNAGYAASPLDAVLWTDVYFGGKPIRNLRPVQGGSQLYGPDLYLISNRNFDASNDTIFLVHVTGTRNDASTTVEVDFLRADKPYGVPPVANQPNNNTFDTNDGRILGAYLEGNRIQFVANSVVPETGLAGVYHGMIEDLDATPSLRANIIGDFSADSLDFGYPNISFTGTNPSEVQCIISFEFSSKTQFPGFAAVYSNYFAYSDMVIIQQGDTYVNILSGAYERWGDYTGSQRVYNQPGKVWVSGNFSKEIPSVPFACRCNATWIAELRADEVVSVGLGDEPVEVTQIKAYPNPIQDQFQLEFESAETNTVQVRILDGNGRLIRTLWEGKVGEGLNRFSFDSSGLASGYYQLVIEGGQNVISTSPLIKP